VGLLPILLPLALAAASPPEAGAERGLWLGGLELCRETVAAAELASDDIDGSPALSVALEPALRAALEEETRGRVGEVLPIRLDGRILAEPVVREPLTAGIVLLTGLGDDAAAVQRAALGPCRRGARR
jgi:hypothetical protein